VRLPADGANGDSGIQNAPGPHFHGTPVRAYAVCTGLCPLGGVCPPTPGEAAHLRDLVHHEIIGVMSDVPEFNMG